jgi:hypothetical protein
MPIRLVQLLLELKTYDGQAQSAAYDYFANCRRDKKVGTVANDPYCRDLKSVSLTLNGHFNCILILPYSLGESS